MIVTHHRMRIRGVRALTPIEAAEERGRQEIRDAIILKMDVYAPTTVAWWDEFDAILKFDPKGR